MSHHVSLSPEVQDALASGRPVVALESTIIAHGMPYPKNVETALRVEQTVRATGAVPATCAIIGGKLKAGLSAAEIERLGRRGAETPMIIAHLAGIRVFATGGIGGVHRGAASTMDISADLQELARTPVAVVCAGAKSILDLELTLEYLETFGVPVLGYQTDEFPAFYTRRSGFRVDYRIDTPDAVARLLQAKWELGLQGGVIVANPVPEAYQLDSGVMEQAITAALADAGHAGIKGKAVTPFLLARVEQLTGGQSLAANIELVCNNARLAGEIANQLID
jgi:pseudouridine-5'-phosphate glycosidase